MVKLRRSCDKCSNNAGNNWCTRQMDMNKAKIKLCSGYKVLPKPVKPVLKEVVVKEKYVADESKLGSDFYNFLKKGGAYSFRKGCKLF